MNCILSFVQCLCCFLPLETTIQYAKEVRLEAASSFSQEEERVAVLLEKASSSLKYYEASAGLEQALEAFLSDIHPSRKYLFTDAKLKVGKTKDPVFLISNTDGQLCYVVKAFRQPRTMKSRFLPELSAMALIQELQLPRITPIVPLAVAICGDGTNEWGLLLETAATGQPINKYALEKLGTAEIAFTRMGQSLAQLHSIKGEQPAPLPLTYMNKVNDLERDVLHDPSIVDKIKKKISIEDFVARIERVKREALLVPVYYSYWHGDPNLGNMFYDDATDQFYFIDVSKMHQSVDSQGNPIVDGTIDLIRIEKNLRRIALGILTDHEVERLLTCFYQAYEKEAGQPSDERLLDFYRTYAMLSRLKDYGHYQEEKDQAIFDQALFWIAE